MALYFSCSETSSSSSLSTLEMRCGDISVQNHNEKTGTFGCFGKNLLLQLLDGLLSELSSGLSLLQLRAECLDLLLVGLLTLVGLLFGNLRGGFKSTVKSLKHISPPTSRDLRLLATTLNSSSSSRILVSPTSARSSAFSRSDSQVASFLAT